MAGRIWGSRTRPKRPSWSRFKGRCGKNLNGFLDLFATNVDAAPKDGSWQVRVEVVGARIISPQESAAIETEVSRELGREIKIFFWSKSQAMVTPEGYDSVEDFTKKRLEKTGRGQEAIPPPAASPATAATPGAK